MDGYDLYEWRLARHFTRRQLAPLLGTTPTSLYRWESKRVILPQVIEILTVLYTDEKNLQAMQKKLHIPLA